MKKNDERRLNIVTEAVADMVIPNITLLNRVEDKMKPLKEMVVAKLCMDLLEEECSSSGNKPYTWMIEDMKGCKSVKDFAYFLPQSYSNNGELHSNDIYSFWDETKEEDDLNDYSTCYM